MSDLFANIATLKRLYPGDENIREIEQHEGEVLRILAERAYAEHPETQRLIDICRRAVVAARLRLATDHQLLERPEKQRELWAVIDARMWFLQAVCRDYESELAQIEELLKSEIARVT